jgi:hypothetical protein
VINDGTISLRLLLASKDEGVPPIEAIGLSLEDGEGEPCHSPDPLYGGQAREIELIVKPTAEQIRDGAFSVSCKVDYRKQNGKHPKLRSFPLCSPASASLPLMNSEPLWSLLRRFSVEDKEMFFGRASSLIVFFGSYQYGDSGGSASCCMGRNGLASPLF